MDEFNADRLKYALDFFILKRFSDDGPLSVLEIQQSAKPIHALLDFFAIRNGRQSLGSLLAALQRLQHQGWLKSEPQLAEASESELVYSLTVVGQQRLTEELARRGSMLSQLIEDSDLDKSFRNFLDRARSPDSN